MCPSTPSCPVLEGGGLLNWGGRQLPSSQISLQLLVYSIEGSTPLASSALKPERGGSCWRAGLFHRPHTDSWHGSGRKVVDRLSNLPPLSNQSISPSSPLLSLSVCGGHRPLRVCMPKRADLRSWACFVPHLRQSLHHCVSQVS